MYPRIQKYLTSNVIDKWNTSARLREIAARYPGIRLQLLHAIDDYDIRWHHADMLFDAAVEGVRNSQYRDEYSPDLLAAQAEEQEYKLGRTKVRLYHFEIQNSMWPDWPETYVRRDIIRYGCKSLQTYAPLLDMLLTDGVLAHNRALASAETSLAIRRLLERARTDH